MPNRVIHLEQGTALWNIVSYGGERHPHGKHWWHDNRHRQPFGQVVVQYIDAGRMTLIEHSRRFAVEANMAAILTYGDDSQYGLLPDAIPDRQGCRTRWVLLEGAGLPEHIHALRSRFGSVFDFKHDRGVSNAMRDLVKLADPRTPGTPGTPGIPGGRDVLAIADHVHRLVMRLFEFGLRTRYAAQSPVERAIDELLRDPLSPVSMKELSQRHGISREHLTRLFRRRVGRSPGQFLADARLERALSLLRETHLPVAAVARQAGYHNVHTMTRQIRAAAGRSPSAVRLDAEPNR
ncbi:MAG: AraC family transcriptional regulator [Phycisphaeraceae bacterium]